MRKALFTLLLFVGLGSAHAQGGITNITSESQMGACDASITAVFVADREYVSFYDASFNLIRRDTLQWNWGGPGPWQLFLTWDNLCAGVYRMVAQDTLGFVSDTTVIDLSAINTINIYTNSSGETSPGMCDGSAMINVQGGVPPYQVVTYNADSSYVALDSVFFEALCDDIYTVHVVDSEGNSAFQVFNVIEGTFSFTNPAITDSIINDSLSASALQLCNINFADVDSIFIQTYEYTQNEDSLIVYWTILMNNGDLESIAQVYYLDTNITTGNLMISLDIYCLTTKSTGSQLRAVELVSMSHLALENKEKYDEKFIVYPNPATSIVHIWTKGQEKFELKVYDIQSREIYRDKDILTNTMIDVNLWPKGIY